MTIIRLISDLAKQGIFLEVEQQQLLIKDTQHCISPEQIQEIKLLKPELIEFLMELTRDVIRPKQQFIKKLSYECDLSPAQQRMLFLEHLSGDNSYYNIPIAFEILGDLNTDALKHAFATLVCRHDVFRALVDKDRDVQLIESPASNISNMLDFSEVDLSVATSEDISNFLEKESHHQFDLYRSFPIRVVLGKFSEQKHLLSINIHHLAADGFCARQLVLEINTAYRDYDGEFKLENIGRENVYQYGDYLCWQKQWLKSPEYRASQNYWQKQLHNAPHNHNLPFDNARPAKLEPTGTTLSNALDKEDVATIKRCAQSLSVTPYVLVQALFAAFLSRYSGEQELCFGAAVANRKPYEFNNSIGLFVNTLVMRYNVQGTLRDLTAQAKRLNYDALKYEQYPFDSLVDDLKVERSAAQNPLIQIMFVMQDDVLKELQLGSTQITPVNNRQNVSKFDLTLHLTLSDDSGTLNWEYNTALFQPETISAMSRNFAKLMSNLENQLDNQVAELDFNQAASFQEKASSESFAPPQCIHTLFEDSVRKYPGSVAVEDNGLTVTYGQLQQKVNALSNYIQQNYACNSDVIGVYMDKSLEMMVSILAIFKAGKIYAPLDPSYPQERLRYMMEDAQIKYVIAHQYDRLPSLILPKKESGTRVQLWHLENIPQHENLNAHVEVTPASAPSYVIYTSGSTGKPKGVLVSHQSLFYSLMANQQKLKFAPSDAMPTIGSQAFGVSLLEFLLPVISGGRVIIVGKNDVDDLSVLIKKTQNSTILHAVPSLMTQLLEQINESRQSDLYRQLKLLLVGAEPVPDSLLKSIKSWKPDLNLRVLYGNTESAVVSSSFEVKKSIPSYYCMGKPHPNTDFYVLNEKGQLQPTGVAGELHIGGLSLATRYLNRPKLTADKFAKNPYLNDEKVYKTGDRVRRLADGNFEFLGRVDHQIKLNGVRIEPGEIESLTNALPAIKETVVHMVKHNDEQTLVLYYTQQDANIDSKVTTNVIRNHLNDAFPRYMRPSVIQYLKSFPLNANGKVDRMNLPDIELTGEVTKPENEIEEYLVALWQEFLGINQVSTNSNFFDIGGNSLLVNKIANKVRAKYDIDLPLVSFFEASDIKSISKVIENALHRKLANNLLASEKKVEDDELDEIVI